MNKCLLYKNINKISENPMINKSVVEFLISPRKKFLYGNTLQTCVCLGIFREMGLDIDGIINFSTTQKPQYKGYWNDVLDIANAYAIESFPFDKSGCDILITTELSLSDRTVNVLKSIGFVNVYKCDWGSNKNMRNIAYDMYIEYMQEN